MSYEAFKDNSLGFNTKQLHAGYDPKQHLRSKAVPIYQTAAFELGDFERCGRLFSYEEEGHSYVRFSNPTNDVLEKRIAALEGGAAALSLSSGNERHLQYFFEPAPNCLLTLIIHTHRRIRLNHINSLNSLVGKLFLLTSKALLQH